jgi:hypothetical protein
MRKTNQTEMEMKVKKAVNVEDPRPDFVESLRQRIAGKGFPSGWSFRLYRLSRRPVWFFLVIGFILASVIYFVVGPKKVYAFITDFNFTDPGLQTVAEAGLVTELEKVSQFTIQDLDNSSQVVTVILDWVYIDEGRLVLGFITESIPTGLVLDMPVIIAKQSFNQNLVFSSISEEEHTDQIIFMAFNPIQMGNTDKQVDFSVDIPLIKIGDPDKVPLAVFHYDLEDVPVVKGKTYEVDQLPSIIEDDLGFRMKSFMFTPSFTEVSFCVNMLVEDILALPKSDINLRIGDGPVTYDYFLVELSEAKDQTCVLIGFFNGGTPENEQVVFQFNRVAIAIMQNSSFSPERITKPNPKH